MIVEREKLEFPQHFRFRAPTPDASLLMGDIGSRWLPVSLNRKNAQTTYTRYLLGTLYSLMLNTMGAIGSRWLPVFLNRTETHIQSNLHTIGIAWEIWVYRYLEMHTFTFHGTKHNAKTLPSSAKTLTTHKPSARTCQT